MLRLLSLAGFLYFGVAYAQSHDPMGCSVRDRAIDCSHLNAVVEIIRPALIEAGKEWIPSLTAPDRSVFVGLHSGKNYQSGNRTVAIGACSATSLISGDDNILVGANTATPAPHTSNFVNIGNQLCFWRHTGERIVCPAPESDCLPKGQ